MKHKFSFDTMQSELIALKDRINYLHQAMEDLPGDIKTKLMVQTTELHTLLEELTLKLDELKKSSTSHWSSTGGGSNGPTKPG